MTGKWKRTHAQDESGQTENIKIDTWLSRKDGIRKAIIRKKVEVIPIEDKLREGRLRWFGHVQLRPRDASVQRNDLTHIEGKKGKVYQKLHGMKC